MYIPYITINHISHYTRVHIGYHVYMYMYVYMYYVYMYMYIYMGSPQAF